jgi:rhodanese-related sulfurtransferase
MNSILKTILTAIIAVTSFTASAAPRVDTPTTAVGFEVITIDQAKALVGKAQFYDFRAAVNFGKGHIKGAIAVPYDNKSDDVVNFDATKDKFDLSKLPTDKNALLVFHSGEVNGWKGFKAATVASKAGYKNIKWMREGMDGWVAKKYPLE